jgi:hypothetical protein
VARSLDAELIHPVAKRVWMKIQDPRRALWTINHVGNLLIDALKSRSGRITVNPV